MLGTYLHGDTKTELRKLEPALYARLYRADREWLGRQSPTPKEKVMTTFRVNWDERDREIVERAKDTVAAIKSMQGKPKRISKGAIGHAIGRKSLFEKHLDKLPITKAYLGTVIEDDEQYRMRRVEWAIEELKKDGKIVRKWEVLRLACIRPEYVNTSIEALIDLG